MSHTTPPIDKTRTVRLTTLCVTILSSSLIATLFSGCAADLNTLRATSAREVTTLNAPMQKAVDCLATTTEERFNATVGTNFDAELGFNEVVADIAADQATRRPKFKVLYAVWPRDGRHSNVKYSVNALGKDSASALETAKATILACNEQFTQN